MYYYRTPLDHLKANLTEMFLVFPRKLNMISSWWK